MWAEKEKVVVSNESLLERMPRDHVGETNPAMLSAHLWGFLNTNLTGAAWEIFRNVEAHQGLEAWRRVLLDVTQKTQNETMELEEAALAPRLAAAMDDVPLAIERW